MSSPAETLASATEASGRYGALDRMLRKRLLATLDGLAGGEVTVRDGLGTETLGEAGTGLSVRWPPTARSAQARPTWMACGAATTWWGWYACW